MVATDPSWQPGARWPSAWMPAYFRFVRCWEGKSRAAWGQQGGSRLPLSPQSPPSSVPVIGVGHQSRGQIHGHQPWRAVRSLCEAGSSVTEKSGDSGATGRGPRRPLRAGKWQPRLRHGLPLSFFSSDSHWANTVKISRMGLWSWAEPLSSFPGCLGTFLCCQVQRLPAGIGSAGAMPTVSGKTLRYLLYLYAGREVMGTSRFKGS